MSERDLEAQLRHGRHVARRRQAKTAARQRATGVVQPAGGAASRSSIKLHLAAAGRQRLATSGRPPRGFHSAAWSFDLVLRTDDFAA
jgi:hypothetical protein